MANFILQPSIEQYLYGLVPARDAVLAEMEARAQRERIPIVGPAAAGLLALLVEISGARRIFEMGSAIGYSTIWLARAAGPLPPRSITPTVILPRPAMRKNYFRRAGLSRRIHIQVGDAVRLLSQASGKFDLIFCDIDKSPIPSCNPPGNAQASARPPAPCRQRALDRKGVGSGFR